MRKQLLKSMVILSMMVACKTVSHSTLQSGSGSVCHAVFSIPDNVGDQLEVWVDGMTSNQLTGVKAQYTPVNGQSGAPIQIGNIPNLAFPIVKSDVAFRSYYNGEVQISAADFNCYDLGSTLLAGPPTRLNTLSPMNAICIEKHPANPSRVTSLWVTNMSQTEFYHDLTVFDSLCSSN